MEPNRKLSKMRMGAAPPDEADSQPTLTIGDESQDVGVIYIYNCVPGIRHEPVCQPPNFPKFHIPFCEPGQKVAWTTIRALIRNRFTRPGTDEVYYINEDGRKQANSLLNPSMHPSSPWEMQLREVPPGTPGVATDQSGNNLNAYGVWWSETNPEDPALDEEIAKFKGRVERTFKTLVEEAEVKAAKGERHLITPREHFAMDYLGFQAPWHQSTSRVVPCPNCGEFVREGIAYHKNTFGDRCIINKEKYDKLFPSNHPPVARGSEEDEVEETVAASTPARKRGRPAA